VIKLAPVHLSAWIIFGVVVLTLLGLDLFVFHRGAKKERLRTAALWSALFVSIGIAFAGFVAYARGGDRAIEYLTAFAIEKSLSVDNLFVFLVLFKYFHVEPEKQHRVLFWGILGAIVFRAIFVFAGMALIDRFEWVLYLLGAVLIVGAFRLMRSNTADMDPKRSKIVAFAQKVSPNKMLVVLIAIELTDVMFAIDSVPAVLAVSDDAFVVYTSNIFALLGLRSLYFVLAQAVVKLPYLHHAVALILLMVGVKMLLADFVHVPPLISLAAVLTVLAGGIVASLLKKGRRAISLPPA
jgi:tellurite resistance protein TerC